MYAMAPCRYGLGDANTTAGIVAAGGSVATAAVAPVAAAVAASSLAAGGSGLILGMAVSTAVPIIGAAIAGVVAIAEILIKNSGCGITCVETSQWANQAEPVLSQNIAAYFSNPAPRTVSQQTAALNVFDTTWARLQQVCGQPGTGDAGVRCITDRQSGACTWKQTSTSPLLNYPGEPQPNECWNWFNGYRDPIANDPDVVPDETMSSALSAGASAAAGSVGAALSSVTSSSLFIPALVVGGLVVVYMVTK